MAHPVDVHVGERIRHRRWMTGITQQQLAECIGITFQQIQKYESGANRVSASRLWDIAVALEIGVAFFFDGLEDGKTSLLGDREAMELLRHYYAIPPEQRRIFFDLARALRHAS